MKFILFSYVPAGFRKDVSIGPPTPQVPGVLVERSNINPYCPLSNIDINVASAGGSVRKPNKTSSPPMLSVQPATYHGEATLIFLQNRTSVLQPRSSLTGSRLVDWSYTPGDLHNLLGLGAFQSGLCQQSVEVHRELVVEPVKTGCRSL